jgi:purine-binding chemotaxis protein CheW
MTNTSANQYMDFDNDLGENTFQMVSFGLGNEEFGIDILSVQEINRVIAITRVPNAPKYVEGVINLRGKIVPVVDLRKRFSIQPSALTDEARIIVIEIKGKIIGLMVDVVRQVLTINKNTIEPITSMMEGTATKFISGIVKLENSLVTILDTEKVVETDFDMITA